MEEKKEKITGEQFDTFELLDVFCQSDMLELFNCCFILSSFVSKDATYLMIQYFTIFFYKLFVLDLIHAREYFDYSAGIHLDVSTCICQKSCCPASCLCDKFAECRQLLQPVASRPMARKLLPLTALFPTPSSHS